MNRYNIFAQVAIRASAESDLWYIQFRGVGSLNAESPDVALQAAKLLRYQAPVVAPARAGGLELPPLEAAPSARAKLGRAKAAAHTPTRYLRIPKETWK